MSPAGLKMPELAAIIYTDIARDGVLKGLNLEATLALAEAVSVPVIASGGLSSMDDITALAEPAARSWKGRSPAVRCMTAALIRKRL